MRTPVQCVAFTEIVDPEVGVGGSVPEYTTLLCTEEHIDASLSQRASVTWQPHEALDVVKKFYAKYNEDSVRSGKLHCVVETSAECDRSRTDPMVKLRKKICDDSISQCG